MTFAAILAHTRGRHRTPTTETKSSFKTTELFAYLAAVVAIMITATVVDGDANTADPFNAEQALGYLTFLTIGYMVGRGLVRPVAACLAPKTAKRSRRRT